MTFYEKYKEFIEQPAHFLGGGLLAMFWTLLFSLVSHIIIAVVLGAAISRAVWTRREYEQHKDHDHEFEWYGTKDLNFIDAGIIVFEIFSVIIYFTWIN